MSDITPPSYIDDGHSFTRRLPSTTSLANVTYWLNNTPSDTASAYTGSYIDDGADLFPPRPTRPGFGQVDPCFYKHRKRHDGEDKRVWNDSIAQAIGGDIQRGLAKMRGLADLEVKRPERSEKEGKKRKARKRGLVSVPAPLRWGTFVIKGDDGRVVIVDEKGECDSGPVKQAAGALEGETRKEGRRWVKAASSTDTPQSVRDNIDKSIKTTKGSYDRKKRTSRSKSHTSHLRNPASKSLLPIPESDYESDDPVKISPLASPTNFIMTGGLSGWPSRAASPRPPSPVVPHAITWGTSSPPQGPYTCIKSKTSSPVRSLPGGWPSPPLSHSRDGSEFTDLKGHKSSKSRSRHPSRQKNEEEEYDEISTKTHSNYQAPDLVEVIYDETPPGEVSYSQTGWNDEKAVSTQEWDKNNDDNIRGWSGSHKDGSIMSSNRIRTISDLGWGNSAKGSAWGGSAVASKSYGSQAGDNDAQSHNGVNDDWDGFERPKTTSEVSVAGSGSERSWAGSQRSHHTHKSVRTDRSQTLHRSSRNGQTDWETSQLGKEAHSNDGWGGSNAQSASSWSKDKSKHGSKRSSPESITSAIKYQNGFDEPNEMYLNETWGEIPVRVAAWQTNVAKWD